MFLIAALVSANLFSHLPHWPPHAAPPATAAAAPALAHRGHVGPWRIGVNADRFAGTRGCAIAADGVSLHRETLIFRVAARGDTRLAMYRLDAGPPRSVSEAFAAVQGKGFFPRRGWVLDPNGGEIALPATYVSGVSTVTVHVAQGRRLRRFRVAQLAEAVAAAKAAGCTTIAP